MRWYCHCPTAHTALLKSHYRGDNAHSFACVRLFLRVVCFILDQTIVASDKCLSYARILLFPTGKQYPVGTHYTVSCVGFMTRCPSGRLPRYARNDTVLRTEWNESLFAEKNSKIYIHSSLCYLVQRTLCHCEAPLCGAVAISRKGHLVIPRKILLYLCREKNEAYDAWNERCCH